MQPATAGEQGSAEKSSCKHRQFFSCAQFRRRARAVLSSAHCRRAADTIASRCLQHTTVSILLLDACDLVEQRLRRHGATEEVAQQNRSLLRLPRAQQMLREPRKPALVAGGERPSLLRDSLP